MTSRKIDLTDSTAYSHWWTDRIRFCDTDNSQHVNNVAFAAYVETGRVYFCKLVLGEGIPENERFIVGRLSIDYLKEMYWPGEVTIGAAILKIGTKSFTVANGVFKDGVCCAVAESVIVFLRDGKSAPVEGVLRDRLLASMPAALKIDA